MASSSISLLFLLVAFCCVLYATARIDPEREGILKSAIAEVKQEFAQLKQKKLSKVQQRLRAFKASTPETRAQGYASAKFERMVGLAERRILQKQRKAKAQTTETLAEALAMEYLHKPGSVLTNEEVKLMFEESECFETLTTSPDCNNPLPQKHRLPNGACNNLENPTWGAAATKMRRLQPPRYDDGWVRTRGFLQGQGAFSLSPFSPPAPSPRVSSIGIIEDRDDEDSIHSHILMQWGQFMDHDLDLMPEFELECPEDCIIGSELEGMCASFLVPADDREVMVTRTDPESTGCHSFRRSLPACPEHGEIEPRQQVNAITHFIDGSMVYHHDPDIQRNFIRDTSNNGGLLKTGPPSPAEPDRALLPDANPADHIVLCPEGTEPCFLAGDLRVNEQSSLTVMHTIWVREHNRVAQFLRRNNPSLSGDKIFLTAQDVVISEIQKITYKDYLPILLGDNMDQLLPPYSGYDVTVEPSVANAFATAAYRYGHSQIQPFFDRLDANYQPLEPLQLVDAFFNTSHVRTKGIDSIVRGLLKRNARLVDEFLNEILTNRLFASDADSPGLDLASLNIQRGRDHGLPGYFVWKQWAKAYCGVESDFRNQLTQIRLIQTYGNLENVDLFIGGLAEEPLPGALVGAVFACIFADTFKSVRDGDRFYYENADPETGIYNAAQRSEIGKSSLSRVLCDNTGITEVQENAFMAGQPRRPCSQIPSMDLSLFNLPGSGSSNLPDICYIKVSSNSNRQYFSVSRRTSFERFFVDQQNFLPGQERCLEFRCPPNDGSDVRAAVVARGGRGRCRYEPNPTLPKSIASALHIYSQRLTSGDMSGDNGLYASFDSCQTSSAVALTYSCTSQATDKHAAKIQTGNTMSEEEVSQLLGDDADEITGGDKSSAEAADSKLAHLMSDLLQQLKAKTNHASAQMDSKKNDANDDRLVSELEKILQKV